ncbi:MAG: site-2 protease family protein, partial [Cyanobacteria bacterium NC_groundwater_1444_Ag_S-0.65um_54_12]|nr:site-2 protease family protein [Cyanobacteria bacterium NC_groundwater_1444_Ag_S-0.65um_54_12]
SITLHEFAHAATASYLGDPTPREAGRVSINPLVHLDPLGMLMIIFGPIGWARPVPVNPNYLGRWGNLLVAAAGPLTNLFLAALAMLVLKHQAELISLTNWPINLFLPFQVALGINLGLAIFNLLPIPPLDGSQILYSLLPPVMRPVFHHILPYGVVILIAMVIFPFGGHLLSGILQIAENGLFQLLP